MDKSESSSQQRETHDFMNVESFSQLPFIRPTPPKDKSGISGTGIRLFGKEFGGGGGTTITEEDQSESVETNAIENNNSNNDSTSKENNNNNNQNNGGESSRRFECHYCCRNFPTSQALGGHQNAHKRERQHAKRAHLQSAMVGPGGVLAGDSHHHNHHLYGLINYHRQPYPASWTPAGGARFYTTPTPTPTPTPHLNHHHHQPTINGSPLAMWRVPGPHGGGRGVLPLFAGEEAIRANSNSERGFVYNHHHHHHRNHHETKSASVQEHVSLDLHL